jgi:hypothetical protein
MLSIRAGFCGLFGYVVVRIVTLGKVDLGWGANSEGILAEVVGLITLILIGGNLAWLI